LQEEKIDCIELRKRCITMTVPEATQSRTHGSEVPQQAADLGTPSMSNRNDSAVDEGAAADADDTMMTTDAGKAPAPLEVQIEETVPDGAQGTTAFFLFSSVHRDRVKHAVQASLLDGDKATIGMVGKRIGQLWKSCSDEVKAAYAAAAKEVRGRVHAAMHCSETHSVASWHAHCCVRYEHPGALARAPAPLDRSRAHVDASEAHMVT
jgi:HMG (high mobility group) box